eukprot:Skav230830  [mRNA]  locus=scaffold2865:61908:64121:- [translate_table: standard]
MELEAPVSLDGPHLKGAKGRSKSPESGPTPGGNCVKIEVKEGMMNKDPGSAGFLHIAGVTSLCLDELELQVYVLMIDFNSDFEVHVTIATCAEELSCHKHESRVEKKGPPGYEESSQAKLTEIATVIEKSESLDDFLDLFPSSFELRGLLSSEADPSIKKKLPKSVG